MTVCSRLRLCCISIGAHPTDAGHGFALEHLCSGRCMAWHAIVLAASVSLKIAHFTLTVSLEASANHAHATLRYISSMAFWRGTAICQGLDQCNPGGR
jgi:hypothetical protein